MSFWSRIQGWFSGGDRPEGPVLIEPPKPVPPRAGADIASMLSSLGWHDVGSWAPLLDTAMSKRLISQPRDRAAFIATCHVETAGGKLLVESMNYSVEALLKGFSRERISIEDAQRVGRTVSRPADQESIANILYGGPWGKKNLGNQAFQDGWKFRGRGLIQITGRNNYARIAVLLGMDIEKFTAFMETREGAAESAAEWWRVNKMSQLVNSGASLAEVRRAVNGGSKGLQAFVEAFESCMRVA